MKIEPQDWNFSGPLPDHNIVRVIIGRYVIRMWANTVFNDRISISPVTDTGEFGFLSPTVPVWVYRAWKAGGPVEPLIDWLIENDSEVADLFQWAAVEG